MNVQGPIKDKIVSYGLLEAAKEAIADFHKQAQNLVQPATLVPPSLGNLKP